MCAVDAGKESTREPRTCYNSTTNEENAMSIANTSNKYESDESTKGSDFSTIDEVEDDFAPISEVGRGNGI
jgi:hypothetical protein